MPDLEGNAGKGTHTATRLKVDPTSAANNKCSSLELKEQVRSLTLTEPQAHNDKIITALVEHYYCAYCRTAMGAVVGEMLASALLRVVAGKLGAAIASEVSSQWRCRGDLESMRSTLAALQAVLHDAERRSSREERVRLWVRRLKSAVYDIEDMLAEFDTDNAPTPNDGLLRKVKILF